MSDKDQGQSAGRIETVTGTGTVAAAPAPTPAPAPRDEVDNVVDSWLDEHVRGSPVAQATEAWNYLIGALDHLKAKIREAL